jgi:Cu(I)/Ag(I) efflux system membrane fusion protein
VDNAKRLLRPGQSVFATVMASSRAHESLVIPQSAIAYIDGRATVFVEVGEGRVNPAPVTLGAEDATHAEVLSGLSEGQRVASAGVFPLKSELFR